MFEFHLHKKFPMREIHFEAKLQKGEILGLFGPSGVGKTSILKMIAGLLAIDEGKILHEEKIWFDAEKKIEIPPQQREIGMVFQENSLFPNMNVRENLKFALPKNADKSAIENWMELTQIGHLVNEKIDTLSGGQRQAVAIARALVRQPKLLLLDEPLTGIDVKWRQELIQILKSVRENTQIPILFVSHQPEDIMLLCDKVIGITHEPGHSPQIPSEFFGVQELSAEVIKIKEDGSLLIKIENSEFNLANNIIKLKVGEKFKIKHENLNF